MFTRSELEIIANLAQKYNVIVVSDEVAQFFYFDDSTFVRFGKCLAHR